MNQFDDSTRTVDGHVKWFDPSRGFGFVVSQEGGGDILLHANVLRNFGQSSIADGARIEIIVQKTLRGEQAIEVLHIEPPEGAGMAILEDFRSLDPDMIRSVPMEPARVKWFDKVKGFGFANVFGRSEDVFIHVEVLRASGLSDLAPGEAVALRVIDGKRGRMATEICPWEAANRDGEGASQPVE
ncbi:cold shock domain-containing protein [Pseudooceanicola sediminis]|uniref:Cold shock domain-containing protein n=1 Tax=Pseudooceanicola sediminis TaxID=2211117 RepID=A0A399J2X7_9RHOB|nr:cold shock domain-containing protein [Pseudooceanicola sediminis]KAA2317320.1 cold shock domain-containing protein [Puniceibacterium sp. HSS470]RII39674.1 cold shock domain-containing protein [Pseudooceanicola sediminis]